MLAHYYDVNLKDRFEKLFGKTDIGREPTPLRNSFLVLTFDFSTVQVGTLADGSTREISEPACSSQTHEKTTICVK